MRKITRAGTGRGRATIAAIFLVACSHSDALVSPLSSVGPFNTGTDVLLTLNPNQDYWPAWTADGKGILYSYVDVVPGPQHRCLGLLPAGGGTRIWQLCDNRAGQGDSVNGIPAYALDATGQLLYLEAVATAGVQSGTPLETTLWLADSAAPFQRRALLKLPIFASGVPVSSLADINWTGATTFIALAQDVSYLPHCQYCAPMDTIFGGTAVVRGTVSDAGAALQVVTGTTGATAYSLAASGASIVFTLRDDLHLYQVPATGGTATAVATVSPNPGTELLGVSCRGAVCLVAASAVSLSSVTASGTLIYGHVNAGPNELRAVTLASGAVQVLRSGPTLVATPVVSPVSGDVVAQVGGLFGHLQTITSSASDLHLYPGLVP